MVYVLFLFLCFSGAGNKAQQTIAQRCGDPKEGGKEENVKENKENQLRFRGDAVEDVEEVKPERQSVFDKAVYDLAHTERVMNDLTFGRRVAFYELRGEIGCGNFSQVKLGFHDLTKGETQAWNMEPSTGGRKSTKLSYLSKSEANQPNFLVFFIFILRIGRGMFQHIIYKRSMCV